MTTILVADFTRSPGGRFIADGEYSGEWFRQDVLVPALRAAIAARDVLTVVLDGTSGYGSSFLEEAFGGLVRRGLFPQRIVKDHLKIKATSPLYNPYKVLAEKYISSAKPEHVVAA